MTKCAVLEGVTSFDRGFRRLVVDQGDIVTRMIVATKIRSCLNGRIVKWPSRHRFNRSFHYSVTRPLSPRAGFTIVELLIVVVVIAILAAITIVTFNGIKDRATVASLKSDLNAASKMMEMAKVDNADSYPSAIPVTVKASPGNVLQLTAVTDSSKQYCLNAYGANNKVASFSSTAGMQDYLCPGATVGSTVGGTAPTAPRGVNLAPGYATWTTTGGMSYNSSTGELACDNSSVGSARSPLIRVDSPSSGTLSYDGMATIASPNYTYSGTHASSFYYAADGTTLVVNASPAPGPYTSNGNAPPLASPFASWQRVNWTMTLGPNIIYLRLEMDCSPSLYTSNTHYRNPTYMIQ